VFQGDKLTEIREINGLSKRDLAMIIETPLVTIKQWEKANRTPEVSEINRLDNLFGVLPNCFFGHTWCNSNDRVPAMMSRISGRNAKRKRKSEQIYLRLVDFFLDYFEKHLFVPISTIDGFREQAQAIIVNELQNGNARVVNDKCAGEVGAKARAWFKLQDNQHLMDVLERSGIYVLEKQPGIMIDTYSARFERGRAYIILGNTRKTAAQRNFDLAHELGHLLMHSGLNMNELNEENRQRIEHAADTFALALLMPQAEFTADYESTAQGAKHDYFSKLKRKYLVSFLTLGMRAHELGLMQEKEFNECMRETTRRRYKTAEPLDDQLVPVRPGRIHSLLQLVFREQIVTVAELRERFSIQPKFLTTLLRLDTDFFDEYELKLQHQWPGIVVSFTR
jgi:Zn-dependent peptidase ImmA (M78 family)/transcriptional regulator with XRE-family HTH domain